MAARVPPLPATGSGSSPTFGDFHQTTRLKPRDPDSCAKPSGTYRQPPTQSSTFTHWSPIFPPPGADRLGSGSLGEVGVTFYDTADVYGCGHSENIRWACEQSLRRLGTDHLDLYQFHLGGYDLEKAEDVLAVFEELVASGKVRAIGWSTDSPERAELFAKSEHCKADSAVVQRVRRRLRSTGVLRAARPGQHGPRPLPATSLDEITAEWPTAD